MEHNGRMRLIFVKSYKGVGTGVLGTCVFCSFVYILILCIALLLHLTMESYQ